MEEVRAEVKKQLVNDPTFMNSVRGQASKAADNAQRGHAGWSNQKMLNRLQADLLPDRGLVAESDQRAGQQCR